MGKIENRQNITGKKGIILFNIFSKLIVCLSAFCLVGFIIGAITGVISLSKDDVNYSELVKTEDFEFALLAINADESEFLELVADAGENDKVLISYILHCIEYAISVVFLIVVFICMWLVTEEIKKNEDKPFTKDNLKVLTNSTSVMIVLFMIKIVLTFFTNSELGSELTYIFIICVFRYLFDAGCKLQEGK